MQTTIHTLYKQLSYALALCILLVCTTASSQTTEEEYRYTIYGYKEQLIKGLNDKEGYFWYPIASYRFTDEGGRVMKKNQVSQFDFIALFRTGATKPCAFVCIYKSALSEPVENWVFIGLVDPASPQNVRAMAEKHLVNDLDFSSNLVQKHQLALSFFAMALCSVEDYLETPLIKNYE